MRENVKPQDFIYDIKRISEFKDNRVFIWYCNLYIEYFIKNLFKEYNKNHNFGYCSECKKSLEPSFLKKVGELCDADLIDKNNDHDKLIEVIYKARNSAGHELKFDEEKTINNIKKIMLQTKKEDPHGLIEKALENMSFLKKLEISATAVIARLYDNLERIKGHIPSEKLIFEIDEKCTILIPKIIDKSDRRF